MKIIVTVALCFLLFNSLIFAQDNSTKSNESYQKSQNNQLSADKLDIKKNENSTFAATHNNSKLIDTIVSTGIIIIEVILLALIMFYWKKNKKNKKLSPQIILKKNIKDLRSENIKYHTNPKFKVLRADLRKTVMMKKIDGKFITTKAKSLAVSKGEIYLAAKLNQLAKQNL